LITIIEVSGYENNNWTIESEFDLSEIAWLSS